MSLIEEENQRKILENYLAKLQGSNPAPSAPIGRGQAAVTTLADSSSLGMMPTLQGLDEGWEAAKKSPTISDAPSKAMDAFLKARYQAQSDVKSANEQYPYQSMALNAVGSVPMSVLPGGTIGKSIAGGLISGAGQAAGHANTAEDAASGILESGAMFGGFGTAGKAAKTLGIIGVKNEGNVANAADAFLANRLKQTAKPLPTEEMGQVLGFEIPPEKPSPVTMPAKNVKYDGLPENKILKGNFNKKVPEQESNYLDSTDYYKSHYPEISDNGAQHLNDIDNRYKGDSKIVQDIHKAQTTSNEPYVWPKGGAANYPIPNYNTKPTGKIGNGMPLHGYDDPFQWADSTYGATKELLQKHAENGIVPKIDTASDLIARDDYLKLIPKDAEINLQFTGLDGDTQRVAFPGHASALRLKKAAERLADNGFTNVNLVPAELSKSDIIEAAGKTSDGRNKATPEFIKSVLQQNKIMQNDFAFKRHIENLGSKK